MKLIKVIEDKKTSYYLDTKKISPTLYFLLIEAGVVPEERTKRKIPVGDIPFSNERKNLINEALKNEGFEEFFEETEDISIQES